MKKETTCAVVVTYNRKDLLIECLDALRKQTKPIDAIYLIDNASTDGTSQLLLEKGHIKELPPENLNEPWEKTFAIKNLVNGEYIKLHYVRMHENTGGAGGFYEGVKRAYEKEYDWLWLMDDDGIPENDCLLKLFKYKPLEKCVVGPLVINRDNPKETSFGFPISKNRITWNVSEILKIFSEKKYYDGLCYYFNAILIPIDIIKTVGFPKKEMFIWGDEIEYFLRIKNSGYKNILLIPARHYHPKDRQKLDTVLLFGRKVVVFSDGNDNFRIYIYFRNLGYIQRKYENNKILKTILKYFIYLVIYRKNINKFLLFIRAYLEGFLGIFKDTKHLIKKYQK